MIKEIFSVKGVYEDKDYLKKSAKAAIVANANELATLMALTIRNEIYTADEVEELALSEMRKVEKKFQKMTDKDVDKLVEDKVKEFLGELFED